MVEVEGYIIDAGNIKFKTVFIESMYHRIMKTDQTGLFSNKPMQKLFYSAFAVGYHFNRKTPIATKSTNHVNLVSFSRDVKELMIRLVLKRSPELKNPKELWHEVEQYAEYGIQVIFDAWKEKEILDIATILEK